jgi:hypothetical protein
MEPNEEIAAKKPTLSELLRRSMADDLDDATEDDNRWDDDDGSSGG